MDHRLGACDPENPVKSWHIDNPYTGTVTQHTYSATGTSLLEFLHFGGTFETIYGTMEFIFGPRFYPV